MIYLNWNKEEKQSKTTGNTYTCYHVAIASDKFGGMLEYLDFTNVFPTPEGSMPIEEIIYVTKFNCYYLEGMRVNYKYNFALKYLIGKDGSSVKFSDFGKEGN
jgi:hypothetical protein